MPASSGVAKRRKRPEAVNAIETKMALMDIKPQIWRTVLVPDSFTLGMLHRVIQIAMGWDDCHMHMFRSRNVRYVSAAASDELWEETACEDDVILRDVLGEKGKKLEYEYDFGDSWQHELVVKAVVPIDPNLSYPVCLGGARACPPEDCGSVPGYYNVLDALRHPAKPESEELLEWLGPEYDPELFDINAVNRRLRGPGWSPMARRSR